VYLNLPRDASPEGRPDLFALTLSTFGLAESSLSQGDHPGDGLSFVKDISALYARLTSDRNWDGRTVRASFFPRPWDGPIDVEVGRVSVVLE
jgi:hypothetical protein